LNRISNTNGTVPRPCGTSGEYRAAGIKPITGEAAPRRGVRHHAILVVSDLFSVRRHLSRQRIGAVVLIDEKP